MVTSVLNTLSNAAYPVINHPIAQNVGIEEIVMGVFLALKGKDLFDAGRPGASLTTKQWALLAPAAKLAGLTLVGGGLNIFRLGLSKLSQDVDSLSSYLTGGYPKGEYYLNEQGYSCFQGIPEEGDVQGGLGRIYGTYCSNSYERDAKEMWGEEILSFDASDPRKKVLILGPHADPASTSPTAQFNQDRFDFLNQKFDLRYKVIDNPLQACREIQKSAAEVALHRIIANVHANGHLLQFGKSLKGCWTRFDPMVSKDCFQGLPPDSKIILAACSTGDPSVSPNIAESIAWLAEREVIAPTEDLSMHGVFYSEGKEGELEVDFKNVEGMTPQTRQSLNGAEPNKANHTRLIEPHMCHTEQRVPRPSMATRIAPTSLGEGVLRHLPLGKIKRGAINTWGLSKGAATLLEVAGKGLRVLSAQSGLPVRFALSASATCAEKIGAVFQQILNLPFATLSWTYAKMKAQNR